MFDVSEELNMPRDGSCDASVEILKFSIKRTGKAPLTTPGAIHY